MTRERTTGRPQQQQEGGSAHAFNASPAHARAGNYLGLRPDVYTGHLPGTKSMKL